MRRAKKIVCLPLVAGVLTGAFGGAFSGAFSEALAAPAPLKSAAAPKSAPTPAKSPDKEVRKEAAPAESIDAVATMRLAAALDASGLPFGAHAAASRVILLADELEQKEAAYRFLLSISERGFNIDLLSLVFFGTLEMSGPGEFEQGYNFYKALSNKQVAEWHRRFISKIDAAKHPKVFMLSAMDAYATGNLGEAAGPLKVILQQANEAPDPSKPTISPVFLRKTLRFYARILFESKKYQESLDVYTSLLLRMPFTVPSDFIEAAWNLYHLKRYEEAIGMVYNLESPDYRKVRLAEKYKVRALSYKALCDADSMRALALSFRSDFADVLGPLKSGAPLGGIPRLGDVLRLQGAQLSDLRHYVTMLKAESRRFAGGGGIGRLGRSIYASEIELTERRIKLHTEGALKATAREILSISETLELLALSVVRDRFDASTPFKDKAKASSQSALPAGRSAELRRWPQEGNFWLGERLDYVTEVPSKCQAP